MCASSINNEATKNKKKSNREEHGKHLEQKIGTRNVHVATALSRMSGAKLDEGSYQLNGFTFLMLLLNA